MPRPLSIIPCVEFVVTLPEDLHTKMTLYLFSAMEGKVPYGARRAFFDKLVREFFDSRELDLAPYAATEPGAFTVRGSPTSIDVLGKTLRGELSA